MYWSEISGCGFVALEITSYFCSNSSHHASRRTANQGGTFAFYLQYMLNVINPQNIFSVRLKDLLAEYTNVDTLAMGFPKDWQNEPLWRQ